MSESAHLAAVSADYDRVAVLYAERFKDELDWRPVDRALIGAFAEAVRTSQPSLVGDLGCGPGHVTAYLHALGLKVIGIDLSSEMITLARQAHPELTFSEGAMNSLDLQDASLGGILSRYAIIHTPPALLAGVFTEFSRVLAPGGYLLMSFHGVEEASQHGEPFDHAVSRAYRWHPGSMVALLNSVGLIEVARTLRQPSRGERFMQVSLLTRKQEAV